MLEEVLQGLVGAGLITPKPLGLTDQGRKQALDFLGLEALPPRMNWRTLKNRYLVARALSLPAPEAEAGKRLATADGLRALVLQKHYNLPTGAFPTLTQATDALVWKQLGLESGQPFTKGAAVAWLLGRLLGGDGKLDAEQLQKLIPAKLLGARKSDAEELRLAAVRRWLDVSVPQRAAGEGAGGGFNLAAFAAGVNAAARATTTGRFGDNKVFIAHVWRNLQADGSFRGMTADEFKSRLVEANREGLLALSRADLVEAMNPDDVRASETRYLNATFHFIQV